MKPIWKRYEPQSSVNFLSCYILGGITLLLLLLCVFHSATIWAPPTIMCALFSSMVLQGNGKVLWSNLRKDGLLAIKKATDHVYQPPYKKMISALLMMASPFYTVWICLGVLFVILGGWTIAFTIPAWVASFINFAAWQDAWMIDMGGKKKYYWGLHFGILFAYCLISVVAYVIVQISLHGTLPGR